MDHLYFACFPAVLAWQFAAAVFYLIAGWQRLCVLHLTDAHVAETGAHSLRSSPIVTRVLHGLIVVLWLPLAAYGATVAAMTLWKKDKVG